MMNTNQNPKAVLVTGASNRLGLEMAKECLDLGYHVIIHYRTSMEPAKSIFENDGRVTFIRAELTEAPQKFMDDVKKLPLTLTGLINNASIFQAGNMSNTEHFHNILTINALIPLMLSAAFAKSVENGWIVNITDAHTSPKSKKYQNYRVSKILLDEITRQLAYLYAPSIRVNAIAPGVVLPPCDDSTDKSENLSSNIHIGKTGEPKHIRRTLKFLIENDYMTGAVIPVDGV